MQNNKLELYLNDAFEKECAYEIEEAEIEFIKTGIETLVNRIVTKVLADDSLQKNMTKMFETYFEGKLIRSSVNIVGAGSFYEGTKNKFPNEFDLIVILYCCEGTPKQFKQYLQEANVFNTVTDTFTTIVKDVVEQNEHDLLYFISSADQENSKLYFAKHLSYHGPATWLRFVYENEAKLKRDIDVDLVAALKISDRAILEHAVKEYCALEEFSQQVLTAGSCFCIGANYSFTPTEVHIIKDMLSENHRKIYRLLKFLINGHGDVEQLTNLGTFEKPYSSFMIKTLMIYHHFRCHKPDNDHLGPCLLEILDEMCQYETSSDFPSLFKTDNRTRLRCDLVLGSYVQSLLQKLRSLQNGSGTNYDYERDRIKQSVSKTYNDHQGTKCFCVLI
jgi:hypothetical protein